MLQFPHLSTSNEIHMGSLELLITESSSRHMPAIGWELSAVLTPGSSVKTGTRGHGDGVLAQAAGGRGVAGARAQVALEEADAAALAAQGRARLGAAQLPQQRAPLEQAAALGRPD